MTEDDRTVYDITDPSRPEYDPAAEPRHRSAADAAEPKNVLAALASALRHSNLVHNKLRALLQSGNRHGDLQAILSALRNCAADVKVLIDDEEMQKAGAPEERRRPDALHANRTTPLQTAHRIP